MTTVERMKMRRKELGLSAEIVAERLGVSPATVYRYEKGDIEKLPGDILPALSKILHTTPAYLMGWEARDADSASEIPPGFQPLPETYKAPIVGRIACGQPITAEENIEGYADVPVGKRVDFFLLCEGDSMIDAGIDDGDVVYIRKQADIENGEIAAVRIDNEATLKRVYKYPDRLVLQPENRSYPPMTYVGEEMNQVSIEGKAVGWTHWV